MAISYLTALFELLRKRSLTGFIVALPVLAIFLGLAALSPTYYRAQGKLRILSEQEQWGGDRAEAMQELVPALNWEAEMDLLRSDAVLSQVQQRLRQSGQSLPEHQQERLKQSLRLDLNKAARTIEVAYWGTRPSATKTFVNVWMTTYLAETGKRHQNRLRQAQQSLLPRLNQSQIALKAAEQELAEFQRQNPLNAHPRGFASTTVALNAIQQDLAAVETQIQGLENQQNQLRRQLGLAPAAAETLAQVSQSQEFRRLLEQMQRQSQQLTEDLKNYTEAHPAVMTRQRDLEDLQRQITAEVQRVTGDPKVQLPLETELKQSLTASFLDLESQRLAALAQRDNLVESLATAQQRAVALPALEQRYQQLNQRLQQMRSEQDLLKQRQKGLALALGSNQSQGEIVDSARLSPEKTAPFRLPLLVAGGAAAAALGLIAMWIAHLRDRSLETVDATERHLNLKVLGNIPDVAASQRDLLYDGDLQQSVPTVFTLDQPGSSAAEAFRLLYLNLKVLPHFSQVKSIGVTSSVPSEGKSTVAANLAAVMAQAGKSVLLVDTNFQRPSQSLIWNLSSEVGLSHLLMSQVSFLLAVQPISPNLDILMSGSLQPMTGNPLESKQMELLLADWVSRYDTVVLDLPAVNLSADAAIVSQILDGVLLVTRLGTLDELNATKAVQVLNHSQANLLGMVINGVRDPQRVLIPADLELDEAQESEFDLATLMEESAPTLSLPPLSDKLDLALASTAMASKPLAELEAHLESLQRQWATSKRLIESKEEELIHLCHAKRDLELQLSQISSSSKSPTQRAEAIARLQVQIGQSEERKQFLLENLATLKNQLKRDQDLFYTHLQILQQRHSQLVS
ncbi:GumC family protein [Lyngbya confervoides]|uniref:Polysaccharide biosynthesis tyrosine autokinase n=1 Tax=Lyngbya confervoides BDU141951 TaxID=1574623 RepID=A0ABD4TAN5_9CYAN|nr:polysaccharide biosynthesis tyrosine autokinase [Lyngbya confervoides]MCM1985227.1 polysaccharide biosynthesis tyrosine autokinase [Lyngbya confervoides BDU141951]